MILTIHQPEHMVWLGLLDKISKADVFVALDTVQFRKNYFQNRNKIRTDQGEQWMTVPLVKCSSSTLIQNIRIAYGTGWTTKYLNKIRESYRDSTYFNDYYPELENIFLEKYEFLSELNIELIIRFMQWFQIKTEVIIASSMGLEAVKGGTEVNFQICNAVDADCYLSGPFGKKYLDLTRFREGGIEVVFHEFQQPEYKQQYIPFIPYMSSIDLLFNYGPEARNIFLNRK